MFTVKVGVKLFEKLKISMDVLLYFLMHCSVQVVIMRITDYGNDIHRRTLNRFVLTFCKCQTRGSSHFRCCVLLISCTFTAHCVRLTLACFLTLIMSGKSLKLSVMTLFSLIQPIRKAPFSSPYFQIFFSVPCTQLPKYPFLPLYNNNILSL